MTDETKAKRLVWTQGSGRFFGITPAAEAPVPAAIGRPPLPNKRLITLVDGTIATRANQGVAQTLRTRRKGSNALVMAHAVASLQVQVSQSTGSKPR